jgi:hypothetical protein
MSDAPPPHQFFDEDALGIREWRFSSNPPAVARELSKLDLRHGLADRDPWAALWSSVAQVTRSDLGPLGDGPSDGSVAPIPGKGLEVRRGVVTRNERADHVESITLTYAQTFGGVPIEGAGLRVVILSEPRQLGSIVSSLLPSLDVVDLSGIKSLDEIDEARMAALTGVEVVNAARKRYVITSEKDGKAPGLTIEVLAAVRRPSPRRSRAEGSDLSAYRIVLDGTGTRALRVEEEAAYGSPAIVRVFPVDPISSPRGRDNETAKAPPAVLAGSQALSDVAVTVHSPGRLSGRFVCVDADPLLGIEPPTSGVNDFRFEPRTNDFAAASAFYHCESMMTTLERLGFNVPRLFRITGNPTPANPFVRAVHRASIQPSCRDGLCINAKFEYVPDGNGVRQIRFLFALGDLTLNPRLQPLGSAADARMAWHELGHALVLGTTGKVILDFAHCGGDAIAAVMLDPQARFLRSDPRRGLTYPWVGSAVRSHMRSARDGWRWTGGFYDPATYPDPRDPMGYEAEQLLASTLFWLYRSTGGDHGLDGNPAEPLRSFAAHHVLLLFVKALQIAGPSASPPLNHPRSFACALIDADWSTADFPDPDGGSFHRRGGSVWKVIHWAFEKQGLVTDAKTGGWPLPVDVYIDDRREIAELDETGRSVALPRGSYEPTSSHDQWFAAASSVWIRRNADGGTLDEAPARGQPSYVYVRVNNRGTEEARNCVVTLYASTAADPRWATIKPPGTTYGDFTRIGQVALGTAVPPDRTAPGGVIAPPLMWTPTAAGPHHLLVVLEADTDPSNLALKLPCAVGPSMMADLVPYDNNLAFRTVLVR